MLGHGTKFGQKKEQAIAALLSHRNVEETAKAAGISAATLKRWMPLPEFKAAYLQGRREVVFQTNARMQQNSGAAASGVGRHGGVCCCPQRGMSAGRVLSQLQNSTDIPARPHSPRDSYRYHLITPSTKPIAGA